MIMMGCEAGGLQAQATRTSAEALIRRPDRQEEAEKAFQSAPLRCMLKRP